MISTDAVGRWLVYAQVLGCFLQTNDPWTNELNAWQPFESGD